MVISPSAQGAPIKLLPLEEMAATVANVRAGHILLPAAGSAIAAGLMLGIGRATAETAALIFTSSYVDRIPESLSDTGRALAVHIYDTIYQ
ncbi:hypothetical protein [Nitrosomonas eutropha]|uniref:Phosphate ABC transporter membrane protein 2 (PhoT family) n=2 Tax=Nitrosomonas eutropha TaxID=916 RepID=A0ABX5MB43_9PROT|nr:hypothetical protein [Nitrosomonas eutropha]ABI58602.1 phosphate ABC transporter membrane protein 2, PhoT family [Nitrosomonas eutropha C91]PXV79717.1 phosphate ABC transporter membrane protein 2 (PhoT family) [Nitrosomonas eutropha]SCX23742.1 phosphate ABC transporter membrane protein 2, PhoT family [Nitrosomonas eutropha]SEJ03158.1 phosphate ABC transporter membrane protein 2, PhoT family [Nitrosomonas eutropha]